VGEVVHRYDIWYNFGCRLSLREVDDLRGRADNRFDVFLFDLFSLSESALKVLHLFLFT
jgi:hypothetical protein